MKTNTENVWLEDEDFRHRKALRIDFKNGFHTRIIIEGHTPEALAALMKEKNSLYCCHRVWSAWGWGTISQDDYLKAVKEQEHIEGDQELAQRLIAACGGELDGLVVSIDAAKRMLDYVLNQPKAIEPAQDNEGWIKWNGGKNNNGERPFTQYVECEVNFRNGEICKGQAHQFSWKNFGEEDDIIGYRTAKKDK